MPGSVYFGCKTLSGAEDNSVPSLAISSSTQRSTQQASPTPQSSPAQRSSRQVVRRTLPLAGRLPVERHPARETPLLSRSPVDHRRSVYFPVWRRFRIDPICCRVSLVPSSSRLLPARRPVRGGSYRHSSPSGSLSPCRPLSRPV